MEFQRAARAYPSRAFRGCLRRAILFHAIASPSLYTVKRPRGEIKRIPVNFLEHRVESSPILDLKRSFLSCCSIGTNFHSRLSYFCRDGVTLSERTTSVTNFSPPLSTRWFPYSGTTCKRGTRRETAAVRNNRGEKQRSVVYNSVLRACRQLVQGEEA